MPLPPKPSGSRANIHPGSEAHACCIYLAQSGGFENGAPLQSQVKLAGGGLKGSLSQHRRIWPLASPGSISGAIRLPWVCAPEQSLSEYSHQIAGNGSCSWATYECRKFNFVGCDDLGHSRIDFVVWAGGGGRRGARVRSRGERARCGDPFRRIDADVEEQGCFGRVGVGRALDLRTSGVLDAL